jgi:hypothetical protein
MKALDKLKFHHLGDFFFFLEPCDYDEILLCKILYFARGMGLLVE